MALPDFMTEWWFVLLILSRDRLGFDQPLLPGRLL